MSIVLLPVFRIIPVRRALATAAFLFIRTQILLGPIKSSLWLRNAMMDYAVVFVAGFE